MFLDPSYSHTQERLSLTRGVQKGSSDDKLLVSDPDIYVKNMHKGSSGPEYLCVTSTHNDYHLGLKFCMNKEMRFLYKILCAKYLIVWFFSYLFFYMIKICFWTCYSMCTRYIVHHEVETAHPPRPFQVQHSVIL